MVQPIEYYTRNLHVMGLKLAHTRVCGLSSLGSYLLAVCLKCDQYAKPNQLKSTPY